MAPVVLAEEGGDGDANYFNALQMHYAHYLLLAMAGTVALYFVWTMYLKLNAHMRRLYGLGDAKQRFFARDDYRMAWLKRNIVDAPLFRSRHNREFQLSRAINMGTLPTRFQAFCLAGLITMNVALCVLHVPFSEGIGTFAEILRNRTGTLATANLIPLVILAGRNNPLIPLVGLSFDTWNLFHRWIARLVALEALAHTFSWIVAKVDEAGWAAVAAAFRESEFIFTGLIVRITIYT